MARVDQERAWLDDARNDPDYQRNLRRQMRGLHHMNQDQQIDYLLQKSHFRSDKKVVNYVNNTLRDAGLPMAREDRILQRNKDFRRHNNYRYFATRHYEYPIFANHFHSFQIDIIDQSKEYKLRPDEKDLEGLNKHDRKEYKKKWREDQMKAHPPELIHTEPPERAADGSRHAKIIPPYIYVFQNVNTKYVRAVAMWHRTQESGLAALRLLWADTHRRVMSLVSDEEPAIKNELVHHWLVEKKISMKFIRGDRHSALGVINRLIRTLRDMNTPEEKSHHQSTHKKYRDFSIYRIAKLIHIYNHTKHDATKMIPAEADMDPRWEESWIIKKLYQAEERKRLSDYQLENGDEVRYILPKQNETGPMVKRRYSLTPERFVIQRHKGHAYVIMAQDGSHVTAPRWRLKLCTAEERRQHPLAETIPEVMRPEKVMAVGPVKARTLAASLRTVVRPDGEHDAWVPDVEDRSEDKLEQRRIFRERAAEEDLAAEEELMRKRDIWFLRNFRSDNYIEGDGLIAPSEGRVWGPGNHTIHGPFDRINGRLIIPMYTDEQRWVLVVAKFMRGRPKVVFYSPEAQPKRDISRRIPGIEEGIKRFLMAEPIRAEDFEYSERGTYPIGLDRPKREDAKDTFIYIAYYAREYIFKGRQPPNDSGNKESNMDPGVFEVLKAELEA
jgi:hypothetical protein